MLTAKQHLNVGLQELFSADDALTHLRSRPPKNNHISRKMELLYG